MSDALLLALKERLRYLKISYCVTCAVAITVLLGVFTGIPLLRAFVPGYPMMRPATAVSFLALASAMAGMVHLRGSIRLLVARSVGTAVSGFSALMLIVFAAKISNAFDGFLLLDRSLFSSDLTSPYSAINFLLLGLSLLLLSGKAMANRFAERLIVVSLAGTFAVARAQLFHVTDDGGIFGHGGLAIPTVILFLVNATALLIVNPESRLADLLFSDSVGGRAARSLIPAAILVPTLIGFLRVIGQDLGLFDTGFGTIITTFIVVMMMCGMVFYYSQKVHRADEERALAESELATREGRYRDLFDYSQSIISTHDIDGKLLSVNRAFVASLGYTPGEMIGARYEEHIAERFRREYPAYLRQVVHEGEAKGLVSMIARDGRTVVWQYHNVLISEPDAEPYVLGSAIDVTCLLKVQNELVSSPRLYR